MSDVTRADIRRIAREVAAEIVHQSATAELQEVSGAEFARILGTSDERALAILAAGEIPQAYQPGTREWRVPLWAIRAWQERRAQPEPVRSVA